MKLMTKILTGLLISSATFLHAQKMHFGSGGGLNITPTSTLLLPGSPINTTAGCAEVIDQATGQIIFYTDGVNIWNTSHVLQSNALLNTNWNSSQLAGLKKSTHAALIAPIPKSNPKSYFVFTTTAGTATTSISSGSGYGPLRVSIVREQSGALPNITFTVDPAEKNVQLTPGGVLVGEKLAITSDGTTCGYWVITDGVGTYGGNASSEPPSYIAPPGSSPAVNTNGLGRFYAYHITETTTTISQLGATRVDSYFSTGGHKSWGHSYGASYMTPGDYTISRGQMKFSQDGKKLACALTNMQEVQLYDFDKTTGLLSSQILLNDLCFGGYGHAGSGCYSEAMPYGLEFSPNGTYLYVSTMGNVTNQGLYQFDITGGTEQLIGQSRNVLEYISNQNSPYYGGIHLGDNGKLYVATYSSNNIGRINFPDHSWGTANGQDSIPIGGYAAAPLYPTSISGYCKLTFPSITKVYPEAVLTASISGPTSICSHDAITVTGSNGGNVPVEYHGWALEECTYTGATVVNGYSSGVLWDSLPLGTPFTFPGSNQLACNKYYKATYVIQNLTNCLTWVLSASKIIKVNCTPSTIVSDDTTICQGSCVILEGEIPFGGEVGIASTWVTSLPGSIMTSPTSNSIQVCPGSTATYTLTKKIKAGCSSWDAVTVTVVNPPVANFSYTVNTSNSSYNVITAVANDLSGSSANGFEEKWQVELLDASGNPISNTGDETVPNPPCWLTTLGTTNFPSYVGGNSVSCLNSNPGQFAKNQVYRITRYVRNANCDWQSYSPNITSPYRLLNHQSVNNGKKTDGAETLTIFPNPSKGLLNLNVENAVDKSYAVEIFDLFGKLVYKNGLTNTQGLQFKTDINLSGLNLPNGLYMVNLTTDTKTFSHRIIIEK